MNVEKKLTTYQNGIRTLCDPVSLGAASLAITVGTEVMGVIAKQNNAKAAVQAANLKAAADNQNTMQSEAADELKLANTQKLANQAKATAIASANENGTSGNSINAAIQDYNFQEQQYRDAVSQQQGWNRSQSTLRKQGYNAQAKPIVDQAGAPAFIGAALRIEGANMDIGSKVYPNVKDRGSLGGLV